MNISEYQERFNDNMIYYAYGAIGAGHAILNGDEFFYHFLGKNSCYGLDMLIHEEDRPFFYDAVERMRQKPQHLIVRLRNYNDHYRYIYLRMMLNGRMIDGYPSYNIEFNDIMGIQESYIKYVFNMKKYRKFMELSSNIFFEYVFDKDELNIYKYMNSKSIPVCRWNMKALQKQTDEDERWSEQEKNALNTFCENVRSGYDYFHIRLCGKLFYSDKLSGNYQIVGGTLFDVDHKKMAVGIMMGDTQNEEVAYYLTEAARDSGTGLLNKRAISEYAMEKLQGAQKPMYLAIMDVDDFKRVNDEYGHMFGDEVLMRVSSILRSVLGTRGIAGRFGGDEFLLVLEGVSEENDLRRILKTIGKHISWAYNGIVKGLNLTTSVGISRYPDDGTGYDQLFKVADKSLYIAKAKGKNRFIIYDEKKHGALEYSEDHERIVGIHASVTKEKKLAAISQMVLDINGNGSRAVGSVLTQIRSFFDIDGIAIYAGEEFKRIHGVGKYIGGIEKFTPLCKEEYQAMFNENLCYAETNIRKLEIPFPHAFELLQKQETCEFIQLIHKADDKPVMMISFDVFNRTRKWSESDISFLSIVGRLMLEVIYREDGGKGDSLEA